VAEPEPQQQPQQTVAELPLEEPKEKRTNKATLDEDAPCSRRATTEHSTRRSRNRRNQKEMKIAAQRLHAYKCTAVDYNFAFAFMVQRRFKGNRKGDRQRRSTPTQRLPVKAETAQAQGPPHPRERTRALKQRAIANTAVALDENGHKLVYQKAMDDPDGEIR
jgi:hypothetical protein